MDVPKLQLLHCLSQRKYLEEALENGLMFTAHPVKFDPGNSGALFDGLIPFINILLAPYKKRFDTLEVFEQMKLRLVIGTISGKVPMICVSEIPKGRHVDNHALDFGQWAVVVSREWLEQQGGDRVIYMGNQTPVSSHLFRVAAISILSGMKLGNQGQVLVENTALEARLALFGHIEVRDNIQESEWRIVGANGFMGQNSDLGRRVPLPLDAIEYVFAPKFDVAHMTSFVNALAAARGYAAPQVMPFPVDGPMP